MLHPRGHWASWVALGAVSLGCARSPPPSRFPTAEAALSRMHASTACSRGVTGESKIDYLGGEGRVRGSLLYIAMLPDSMRFDAFSPFGAVLSTLTTDGARFALYDLREKSFLRGSASACNLRRFTRVPLPPHAFVQLLRGEAPVLRHDPAAARLDWDAGAYRLRISGAHRAEEEIRLVPTDADWNLPWSGQRVRVTEVAVWQAGVELYRVELDDHRPAPMAAPRVDPDGIDPPIAPSGPVCRAEVPRRLKFEVASEGHDVVLLARDVHHNPPLTPGVFEQLAPPGVSIRESSCLD